MPRLSLESPVGPLTLAAKDERIIALDWTGGAKDTNSALLAEAAAQLRDYFAGRRQCFDLPLAPAGSASEQRIWALMAEIPYGETRSYGDLAQALDLPARAIGRACGRNPIPILLPCHRVLGRDGALVGYSGGAGIETKRQLLQLEHALLL